MYLNVGNKTKIGWLIARSVFFLFELIELFTFFYLAFFIRYALFNHNMFFTWDHFLKNNYWVLIIFILVFIMAGIWKTNQTFWYEWRQIVSSGIIATLLSYAFVSVLHSQDTSSRFILGIYGILVIVLFPLIRYLLKIILHNMGLMQKRFLFLGEKKYFLKLKEILKVNKYIGICLVDKQEYEDKYFESTSNIYQYSNDIFAYILKNNLDGVILQTPTLGNKKIDLLAEFLLSKNIDVIMFPISFGYNIAGAHVYHLMYENYFLVRLPKGLHSKITQLIKRVIDIISGIIALIILSPIMLGVSLLIFIFDGLPVIYKSKRYGKNGRLFDFYKFRYMIKETSFNPDYEKEVLNKFFKKHPELLKVWQEYKKLPVDKDPRIIPKIGKIIAKFDLSELAQIFNIIKGDMSLVGPRPYLPREKQDMGDYFLRVVSVKPGLTGLWQVMGGNKRTFKERLEIDTWYIKNWSLWLDIIIILKTVQLVVKAILKRIFNKKNKSKHDIEIL